MCWWLLWILTICTVKNWKYTEVNLVTCNWVACTNFYFIFVLYIHYMSSSLRWRFPALLHLTFFLCEVVRLFRYVITYHVHCAELPALWVSCGRNCELCQSAWQTKRRHLMCFRRIAHYCERNSNSKYRASFIWRRVPNLEKSQYFGTYSPKTTQKFSINPGLTNVSEW